MDIIVLVILTALVIVMFIYEAVQQDRHAHEITANNAATLAAMQKLFSDTMQRLTDESEADRKNRREVDFSLTSYMKDQEHRDTQHISSIEEINKTMRAFAINGVKADAALAQVDRLLIELGTTKKDLTDLQKTLRDLLDNNALTAASYRKEIQGLNDTISAVSAGADKASAAAAAQNATLLQMVKDRDKTIEDLTKEVLGLKKDLADRDNALSRRIDALEAAAVTGASQNSDLVLQRDKALEEVSRLTASAAAMQVRLDALPPPVTP